MTSSLISLIASFQRLELPATVHYIQVMKLSDYSMTMLLKPSILSYLDVVTIEILVVVAVDTLDDVDDDVEIELDVDKL